MKVTVFAVVVLLFAGFAVSAPQQSPKIEVPSLPTEKNQFGGRPGSFQFVTNEQTMADAAQLKETFAALDRLDSNVAKLDPVARERFSKDISTVRQFALSVHQQRMGSAGPVAAEVEQRLNDAKGNFMCGACHGHGMMRGRGMGGGPMGR